MLVATAFGFRSFWFIAAVLAALEAYFSNAIIDTGRTWHTSGPDWPFHEPGLLLQSINLPGWVLTLPVVLVYGQMVFWMHCLVAVPFIIFWWRLVGQRLDFGLVPARWLQVEKPVALLPAIIGLGLAALGMVAAVQAVGWSSRNENRLWSYESIPIVSLVLWCAVLAAWSWVVAIRIREQGAGTFDVKFMILSGLASNAMAVSGLMVSESLLHRHGDANIAIWFVSSAGILLLLRPRTVTRIGTVAIYNGLSNACLMALVNNVVFEVVP